MGDGRLRGTEVEMMNWKWAAVGILGFTLGMSIAPYEQKTVIASTTSAGMKFQIQAATVDESNGEGHRIPVHEVFLLNTHSGEVWQFQGAAMVFDRNTGEAMPVKPKFSRVEVEFAK